MIDNSKNRATRGAFTLVEILVVLTIMGFLVALVAPKLVGVVDRAVGVSDDSNQERLRKVLNVHVNETGRLTNGLANLVITDENGTKAAVPSVDDGNRQTGPAFLSATFVERMKPQVHYLNAQEAAELVSMGMNSVRNLGKVKGDTVNDGSNGPTGNNKPSALIETMVTASVKAGLPVLMAGFGAKDNNATWAKGYEIEVNGSAVEQKANKIPLVAADGRAMFASENGTYVRMDEGKLVGRILMGITEANGLVQRGLLDAAGVSPNASRKKDFYTFGNYIMVLPRLNATVERMKELFPGGPAKQLRLNVIGLTVDTGESATGNTIKNRSPKHGCRNGFRAGRVADVTTASPEGYTWGNATNKSFAISLVKAQ